MRRSVSQRAATLVEVLVFLPFYFLLIAMIVFVGQSYGRLIQADDLARHGVMSQLADEPMHQVDIAVSDEILLEGRNLTNLREEKIIVSVPLYPALGLQRLNTKKEYIYVIKKKHVQDSY